MNLGNDLGHLTYSTLVHPGDTWEEAWDSLNRYLPAVKERVSPHQPFGICQRISRKAADRLTSDEKERARLKSFLAANDMYVFTANAFPYGSFKGERVKELVYEPDWRTDDRADYTIEVASILAAITPEGVTPSIQSPPCGFKPRVTGRHVVDDYTRQILRVVAHLVKLEQQTGRTVTLGLEPEPACFLELTSETIDYFQNHLFSGVSAMALARDAGISTSRAEDALRKHLGTVFDICHQAVEYEDIGQALASLRQAGIPIMKLQAAAGIVVPNVTQDSVNALRAFDDPVYLHQTMEKAEGTLRQYLDLPDAFESWAKNPGDREWRVHFHVPIFLEDVGPFATTQFAIREALQVHKASPVTSQIEIETYTWNVLPDILKTGNIVDYVAREIQWLKDEIFRPCAASAA